jgi:lipoprotein-releasing system permease protein
MGTAPPKEKEPLVITAFDPHASDRPQVAPEDMFDPSREQHTGVILGLAISSRKFVNPETGKTDELFMLRPGDDVQITLPTAGPNLSPVSENCTVVDFYASNMHEYDASFAFLPLRQLQAIRGMIDPMSGATTVSAIQIKLRKGADLVAARNQLIARYPPQHYPFDIRTWQDTQAPLLSAVNLELTILNLLLFLIIAVAGFGILATFFMIVVEKTKDIGILKALGAPNRGVMAIFMNYGLALGAVGTGAGIALGCLFVLYINEIADLMQYITGREIFDPTIYYFSEIPTIVCPWMIAWVAAGAMAIAILASVLPALRAAKLRPVEALRYE